MIKGLKTSSNWSLFRPEHPWFTVDEFFMTILFNFLFLCFQSLSEESKFEFLQLGNTSATSLYIFQTEFYVCQDKYQISCETSGSFMFIFQDWILIKNILSLGNVVFTEGKVELKSTRIDANGLEKFHLDCSIRLNKETVAISNFQKTFSIATGFNSSHLKPQENIDLHFDINKIQKNVIDLNVFKKESSSLESYFEVCFI